MAKLDVVQAQLQVIQAAEVQALTDGLGACYDQGMANAGGTPGTFTQADIDAAVSAAVGPLNDQILGLTAQDQADQASLQDAQAAMSDLQSKFDALAQKENVESGIIAGLQSSLSTLQDIVSQLQSIQLPGIPDAPATLKKGK